MKFTCIERCVIENHCFNEQLWGRAFLDSFQNQVRASGVDVRREGQESNETQNDSDEERNQPLPANLRARQPFRIAVSTRNRQPRVAAQPHIQGWVEGWYGEILQIDLDT